jgi:aspartyl-tRNA(Asn)/glutamyl-tRNA(Gln) amidotransferase subunit A
LKPIVARTIVEIQQAPSSKNSLEELHEVCLENCRKLLGSAFREVWDDKFTPSEKSSKDSPLKEIPYSLKDNIVTQRGLTCAGSTMLAEYKSPFDASCHSVLRDAGAYCVGKTNMDEFSMGTTGATCAFANLESPWKARYSPGGSSSGAAISVATGCCIFSLGSDSGGSIRQPAAHNGVLGVKPTYGRISRYGLIAMCSSTDTIGLCTRHAKDARLILEALGCRDQRDLSTETVGPKKRLLGTPDIHGLVFGIPNTIDQYCEGEVLQSFHEARKCLERLGVRFQEIDFCPFENSLTAYKILSAAESFSNLARYDGVRFGQPLSQHESFNEAVTQLRTENFGYSVRERITLGAHVLAHPKIYASATSFIELLRVECEQLYAEVNGFFLPTVPALAKPLTAYIDNHKLAAQEDLFLAFSNLLGTPSIAFPIGMSHGLPQSAQLCAPQWQEGLLLQVIEAFQQESDFHTQIATLEEIQQ